MARLIFLCVAFAFAQIASIPARAADITFTPGKNGGGYILLSGEIKEGDAAKLRKIAAAQQPDIIFLKSDGGNLPEAIEIGRIVSISQYITVVRGGDLCASACALIWLAGEQRFAQVASHIGFHASYTMKGAEPVTSGMANALIGRYLTQLNLSADAIMFATSASPESMLWVDTGHPGKEGISYTILPADNPSTEPASPPAIETVAIDRQASPSIDGTHYGKWTVHAGSDLIAIFSASTEGKGLLAYICPPSKNCRFALSLELGCDAGDQYVISYQVDSYSKKDVIATCDTDKKFLYLDNGASFMKDISNEVGVTFYTRKINGDDVSVRFNLVGFDDANAVLTKAGYLGASSN